MRPVCVRCKVELRCDRNQHKVETMAGEKGYQLWDGDRYKCPSCFVQIVVGFGAAPYAEYYHDCYARYVEEAEATGDFTRVEE